MGQTVHVCWETATEAAEGASEPSPSDASAGRTAMQVGVMRFDYRQSAPERTMRLTRWTRPGTGRVLFSALLPPGRDEPLALGTSLELQAVAVVDVAAGEAHLRRRDGTTRLVLPATKDAGDTSALMRLYLDIEPID